MIEYQYFTNDELKCHGLDCCGGESEMNHNFMIKVVSMRRETGIPFIIPSAYRCPVHNSRVSLTGSTGPHTTGRAVDIKCRGRESHIIMASAFRHGITGIGVNQKGKKRYIHIDDLTGDFRPWVWSY